MLSQYNDPLNVNEDPQGARVRARRQRSKAGQKKTQEDTA